MTVKVRVRIEGINEIRAKLMTADPIYAEPVRKAITEAAETVEARAKKRAPVLTGKLQASVKRQISPQTVPLWAKVTAEAERKSFRYPWALEAGKGKKNKAGQHSITKYRGTRKKTRRWFRGSARGLRKLLQQALSQAAREIAVKWSK